MKTRKEARIVEVRGEPENWSSEEKMVALMVKLANREGGKYPHAFGMMEEKRDRTPVVFAACPEHDRAVFMTPKGMFLAELNTEAEKAIGAIEEKITYCCGAYFVENEMVDTKKEINNGDREALGIKTVTRVNVKNRESWAVKEASETMQKCEAYWEKPLWERQEMTVDQIADAF